MIGMRVLIVEDDPLIAMDLEDELSDRGFVAVCATSVARARALMDGSSTGLAILDMHLGSDTSFAFATDLMEQGVPFFFLSGNDASALPPHLAGCHILTKPVRTADVVKLIEVITGARPS